MLTHAGPAVRCSHRQAVAELKATLKPDLAALDDRKHRLTGKDFDFVHVSYARCFVWVKHIDLPSFAAPGDY